MSLLFRIIEHAMNLPLRLQGEAPLTLASLAGRIMRIELTQPTLAFDMQFESDTIRITPPGPRYDVRLRGSLTQFITLMRSPPERTQAIVAQGLTIEGDMDCALAVKRALGTNGFDWEEGLARILGDIPAEIIARGTRKTEVALKSAIRQTAANTVEFLQEEWGTLVRPPEVDSFLHAVDVLRSDVDRLAQRIQRLGPL